MNDLLQRLDTLENKNNTLEEKLNRFIAGMDRGIGTAIAETEKAESGEEANIAAVRGLKAIKAQIEKIKKS